MITEIAILDVKPGQESAFEADFKLAGKYISAINGYMEHALKKCIEKPNRYILIAKWQKIEDHEIGFRQSPEYVEWKKLQHHYYDPFPEVQHYVDVFP